MQLDPHVVESVVPLPNTFYREIPKLANERVSEDLPRPSADRRVFDGVVYITYQADTSRRGDDNFFRSRQLFSSQDSYVSRYEVKRRSKGEMTRCIRIHCQLSRCLFVVEKGTDWCIRQGICHEWLEPCHEMSVSHCQLSRSHLSRRLPR